MPVRNPATIARATIAVLALGLLAPLAAETRTPEEAVDAFNEGLRKGDAALALSLLTRDVVVFELGLVDTSRNAYAASHLPADMAAASRQKQQLLTRRSGGTGEQRWVVSTYRRQLQDRAWTELETMILRRVAGHWRIIHIHWSSQSE